MPANHRIGFFRSLLIGVGALATLGMVAISMRLNYLYGYSLGQTVERAQAFAWMNVIADVWKGIGPIFLFSFIRAKQWVAAITAGCVWLVCLLFAVTSALGLAAQDRMAVTGGRETVRAGYEAAREQLSVNEVRLAALARRRSSSEIEAAIAVVLARAIGPTTIGALSRTCTKADPRTIDACAEVARLRQELAAAVEAARLEHAIAELRRQVSLLGSRGGAGASDPQAELVARLTLGWVSVVEMGTVLVLLMAVVIEMVSAFGPVVLSVYADTCRRDAQQMEPRRDPAPRPQDELPTSACDRPLIEHKAAGNVLEYLAERLEPAGGSEALGSEELHADYAGWCQRRGLAAAALEPFTADLDEARAEQGLSESIRKFGSRYFGVRVVADSSK